MKKYLVIVLILINLVVWGAVLAYPDNNLHFVSCDVGQGDGILLSYKTVQVLVDGGPNSRVLDCLGKHMPFWDKTVEVVILTHPQADHYMGLIDVFKNYKIKYFLGNQVDAGSDGYGVLKSLIGGSGAVVVNPASGLKMKLDLIYLDIVWPSQSLAFGESAGQLSSQDGRLGVFDTKRDLNDFSIIGHFKFGDFDLLTTGDIGGSALSEMVQTGGLTNMEALKVPHHGSKNGLTEDLLNIVDPAVAIISAGRNNRYGHPHKEILDMLGAKSVRILRTDQMGDIEIVSNGKTWWLK